jgi:hypothetical protein
MFHDGSIGIRKLSKLGNYANNKLLCKRVER